MKKTTFLLFVQKDTEKEICLYLHMKKETGKAACLFLIYFKFIQKDEK
jgi:hypothetical protein